jgi:hypothetical protein
MVAVFRVLLIAVAALWPEAVMGNQRLSPNPPDRSSWKTAPRFQGMSVGKALAELKLKDAPNKWAPTPDALWGTDPQDDALSLLQTQRAVVLAPPEPSTTKGKGYEVYTNFLSDDTMDTLLKTDLGDVMSKGVNNHNYFTNLTVWDSLYDKMASLLAHDYPHHQASEAPWLPVHFTADEIAMFHKEKHPNQTVVEARVALCYFSGTGNFYLRRQKEHKCDIGTCTQEEKDAYEKIEVKPGTAIVFENSMWEHGVKGYAGRPRAMLGPMVLEGDELHMAH